MFGTYTFTLNIDNRTSGHVTFVKDELIDGRRGIPPTLDVPPQKMHTNAYKAETSTHGLYGTEGTVFFQVGSDATATVSVYWFISSGPKESNVTPNAAQGVNAKIAGFDGGDDDVINVTLTLTEG